VNYNNCLKLSASTSGLWVGVFPPLGPFHPTLFIPCSDVSAKVVSGWVWSYMEFRFAEAPTVSFRILATLGGTLAADANHSWADGDAGVK
jgi:hypothetical protein